MTIKWRNKLILAKAETIYGTDPTPTGAANAMLMTDVSLAPMEGEDVSRELIIPYLGNQGEIVTGLRKVLTGSTELVGSGAAGTPPAWGPLMRACGFSETIVEDTSVTYARVSDDHESATVYYWEGGTLHKMLGVRGTGVLTVPAQGLPRIAWTLTGLWIDPTDTAQQTPTFTPWKKPQVASKANTPIFKIDDYSHVMRTFSLNFGNDVQPRLLVNSESIDIVDMTETATMTINAVPLATFNPFAKAQTPETPVSVELQHGTAAGSIITLDLPLCEVARPPASENGQGVTEWPLTMKPQPDQGDDQLTITLT